jgi:Mannosyl-glycoprotein endo-beta-N-acetylglucosaminidase
VGGDVVGRGQAGSPGSGGASPYRAGDSNYSATPVSCKKPLPKRLNATKERRMKFWAILAFAFGLQVSSRASEENVRTFRAIDPNQLDTKVPHGFGKVFVEAGRQNNIDPLILAAISAHESGAWKSRTARLKNNWMGLMAGRNPKRFATPAASIFYAAELLNRRPFRGHSTLASIAPIYCATNPTNWKRSVHQWSLRLMPG